MRATAVREDATRTDVREWIATEAAALAERQAAAQAEAMRRQVAALRAAIEAALGTVEGAGVPRPDSPDLQSFADRVSQRLGIDELRTELEDQQSANRRLAGLHTAMQAELAEARRLLTVEQARAAVASADAAQIRESLTALQAERQDQLLQLQEQVAALQAQVGEQQAAHQRLLETHDATQAELDEARRQLTAEDRRAGAHSADLLQLREVVQALEAQLQDHQVANQRLSELQQATRAELDDALRRLAAEQARASAAAADAVEARDLLDHSLDDLRREQEVILDQHARTYSSLPLDQLLSVFRGFDKARTVAEIVVVLVDGIAREFPRVALFSLRNGGLRCRQQVGFDFQTGDSNVVVPLLGDSLLKRCVESRKLEAFYAGVHHGGDAFLPFGGTPECALAIPLVVKGAVTAVIYADDSSNGKDFHEGAPQARVKFADLLFQHARMVLFRIEAERRPPREPESSRFHTPITTGDASLTSEEISRALREYAMKLTDELEYDYKANAEIGRNRLECEKRLKERLVESRRLYAERILRNPVVPRASGFLDEHLVAVARARQDSFGRALHSLLAS